MKKRTLFFASILTLLFVHQPLFATSGITYHGRLLKPNNTPVTSNVQFKMQIRTPGTEDCLLYEEIQTQDLTSTSGVFSVSVGDGTGTRTDDHSADWSLFDSLSNRKTFNFATSDCNGFNVYTPGPGDNRKFRVFFDDGSGTGWQSLPTQAINYIPMSVQTYAIGGFTASSLFRVEDSGTLGNIAALTTTQYNNLVSLANGSSSVYEKSGELGGHTIPSLGNGQSFVSDGSGGWVASTPLTTESDPTVSAFAKASLPTCTTGEVLKSDGTALSCVPDAGGWSEVDATDSTKGIVMVPTSGGLEVSSGSIGLPTQASVTPGTATKVTVDAHGIITGTGSLDETDIPTLTTAGKVSGDTITSGTISGTTAINTSGTIKTTGTITGSTISGGIVSSSEHRIYDLDGTPNENYVALKVPASISANYDMVLPGAQGTANQILGMNNAANAMEYKSLAQGSGVTITHTAGTITISATGTGGTVTEVTGTAPIQVTNGTTTPAITIDQATTSAPGAVTLAANGGTTANTVVQANDTRLSDIANKLDDDLLEGQVFIGDSSNKADKKFLSISDIRSTALGNAAFFPLSCTAAQTMTWKSPDDVYECSDISIPYTKVSGLTASNISNTAAGNLSSTNVQDSLAELDSDLSSLSTSLSTDISGKVAKAGDTMSGNLDMGGHQILNIANVPFVSTNPTGTEDGQTLRWNNGTSKWEWFSPGVAGTGIVSINSLNGTAQTLTTAISGTAPSFNSSGSTHTLNIPLASTASVTAGLISKTDYDNFNGKLGTGLVNGNIWIGNSSGQATARSITGDISLTNTGAVTVTKIQSTPVSSSTPSGAGQILKYNGSTQYEPAYFGIADLKDGSGTAQFPSGLGSMATENASDYLTKAGNLSGLADTTTARTNLGLGTAAVKAVGTSTGNLVELDATGRFPSSTLPVGGYDTTYFKQNGNSFGTSATLGTNDAQPLNFETNNATRMTILSNGNVGMGTTTPLSTLHVATNQTYAIQADVATSTASNGATLLLTRSRGTIAAPTKALNGDVLGGLYSRGYADVGNFGSGSNGAIEFVATEDYVSNTNRGVDIVFAATQPAMGGRSERLRITGAGNVGIGTTNPVKNLDVVGNVKLGSPIASGSQSSAQSVSSSNGRGFLETPWIYTSNIESPNERATASTGISIGNSALPDGTITLEDQINLYTNGASRLHVEANGYVGIGTTNPTALLHVNGAALATAWNTSSDVRLKEHITEIENPLDKILQLRGVEFDWRSDVEAPTKHEQVHDIGVIAQEVEKVFPEAVTSPKDGGYKSVAYSKLIAPVIGAVQELYHRVIGLEDQQDLQSRELASVKAENAQLKQELNDIKARLDRLEKSKTP